MAAEQNLSLSLLRQFNPELSSWPSEEPLPAGTTLLLPVYRSTTPIPAGAWMSCLSRRGEGELCTSGSFQA